MRETNENEREEKKKDVPSLSLVSRHRLISIIKIGNKQSDNKCSEYDQNIPLRVMCIHTKEQLKNDDPTLFSIETKPILFSMFDTYLID